MSKPRFKLRTKADGVAPTFPPLIQTATAFSKPENAESRIALLADQGAITWSIVGGADAAKFSIDGTDLVLPAKDYEIPDDSGANNTYVVTVQASNANGTAQVTITVTITDAVEGASGNAVKRTQIDYADTLVVSALSTAATTDWITLTVSGNVKAKIWLMGENGSGYLTLSNGDSLTFRKWELIDMPVADATLANEAQTGTWSFSWNGGANTSSISWVVSTYPVALAFNYGIRNPAGYGGFAISEMCPGNASDWTFQTGGNPSSYFTINANYRLTSAGTYGSNKTMGTPASGTQYTVVLKHTPGTYSDRTITITIADIISIAPNPGVDTPSSGSATAGTDQLTTTFINRYHGDTVVMENGTYNTGVGSNRQVLANTYFIRAVNPATSVPQLTLTDSTGPYGSGAREYTGRNHSTSWITYKSRYPQGANLGPYEWDVRSVKVDGVNTTGYIGVRVTGCTGSMFRFNNLSGTSAAVDWVMVDHCAFAGYTPQVNVRDTHRYFYINHNWCHDGGTGIYLVARYSQVSGNLCEKIQNDPFNLYLYDSEAAINTWDQRWSRWCWNTNVRKDYIHPYPRTGANQPHPDGNQIPEYSGTTHPILTATASNYVVPFMLCFGNVILRTNGTKQPDSSGVVTAYDEPDMQGFNGGTMKNTGRFHDVRMLGETYNCMYTMGIAATSCDSATSFIRNCTAVATGYQNNFNPLDVGYSGYNTPEIWGATHSAGNGMAMLDHNAIQNSGSGGYILNPSTPVPNTPTQVGEVHNFSSTTDFVKNDDATAWANVEKWRGGPVNKANLAPTTTSRLRPGQAGYPASGTRVCGAHDVSSVIDLRLRTVGTSYKVQ